MKQYTIENAYNRNDKVTLYENGETEYCVIMCDWEVKGYCNRLKEEGYVEAYDVDKYKEKMEEAKKEYEWQMELYNMAKQSPLIKK